MSESKVPNFNIAFGLTSYDDNYESIEDPKYAFLKARVTSWSPEVDSTIVKQIAIHPCTREELGLDGDNPSARFFSPHKSSEVYIEKYWKKMQCTDLKTQVILSGSYNSDSSSSLQIILEKCNNSTLVE